MLETIQEQERGASGQSRVMGERVLTQGAGEESRERDARCVDLLCNANRASQGLDIFTHVISFNLHNDHEKWVLLSFFHKF